MIKTENETKTSDRVDSYYHLPCPQCTFGIDLSKSNISGFEERDRPLLRCEGGHSFSYKDALSKAAGDQDFFGNLMFVSDVAFIGRKTTEIGKICTIKLPEKVHKLNYVIFTPYHIPGYNVFVEPWKVNDPYFSHENIDSFHVVTSVKQVEEEENAEFPRTVTFGLIAYGATEQYPAWKELLHKAKNFERIGDYRTAIIDADSAFETFVTEILDQKLTVMSIPQNIVTRALNDRGEKMRWIEGLFPKFQRVRWNEKVAKPRNKAMHKGEKIRENEASECFKAIFESLSDLGADLGSFTKCKSIFLSEVKGQ